MKLKGKYEVHVSQPYGPVANPKTEEEHGACEDLYWEALKRLAKRLKVPFKVFEKYNAEITDWDDVARTVTVTLTKLP